MKDGWKSETHFAFLWIRNCNFNNCRKKVEELLDSHGYKGQYEITQIPLASAPEKSRNYDFIVATSIAPQELHCPYVNGVAYLMGVGMDVPNQQILKLMEEE